TPPNPGAWLTITARNRAIDRIRRDRTLTEKTKLLEVRESEEHEMDETTVPDERLELIFTCCHPSLALEAQVALTLRALGGLTTDEIARAFLVEPETMKRRLTRAKLKIKDAGIPFSVPPTICCRTGSRPSLPSSTSSSTRATAAARISRPRRSDWAACLPC